MLNTFKICNFFTALDCFLPTLSHHYINNSNHYKNKRFANIAVILLLLHTVLLEDLIFVIFFIFSGGRSTSGYRMTLNLDQDDQIEICGYRKSTFRTALTYTLIFLTAGILRLVYHWVPRWFLKSTCIPCHVKQAQYILVTVSK